MGQHWRKPFPKPPVRETPTVIAEVTALIRSIFNVEWLPFDEKRASFRRRFAGTKRKN